METTVETLEENRAKLTVVVDAADVDASIKKAYRDFANKYSFPGFRKGKAPRPIIDNVLGKEAALASATDDLVNEKAPLAVDDSGLYPIGRPTVNADELVEGGKPYEFTIELEDTPAFELSSYDDVKIELPPEKVTEAEIDAQVEDFRAQLATFEDCDDAARVEKDGYAEIAVTATDDDGEEIASLTSDASFYRLGLGLYPDEFDEKLVGLKKGEGFELELATADQENIRLKALADKTKKIKMDVKVNAVKEEVLPEVTDEWARENDFDDVAALRTRIGEALQSQKDAARPALKENACLTELAERLEGEPPESLCEQKEAELLQDFFVQLQSQGLSFDIYLAANGLTSDQFKEDVKKQAADTVRQDLALDAWVRHAGISVTSEDMSAEFAKSAAEDPAALEQEWREAGRLHVLRQGMLRARAAEAVMEGAEVSEAAVTPEAAKAAEATEAAEAAEEPEAAQE